MRRAKHSVMDCPKYEDKRKSLLRRVVVELTKSKGSLTGVEFASMHPSDQLAILLGKRFADPKAEDRVDRVAKRFLSKCWNLRSEVTNAVNDTLFTSYGIYSALVA